MTHPWPVVGHDWAVDHLRKALANRRVRHAYLITGTPQIGKSTLAHAFAMTLNCTHEDETARPCGVCPSCKWLVKGNHPDLLYAEHDANTGTLKINTVREIMRLLALKPYDARYRIAILEDFDRAQGQAQDALLKTLEEPSPQAVLLLVASRPEKLLSTITSRCQIIRLRPVATSITRQVLLDRGADPDMADLLAGLSAGRIGWAIAALDNAAILEKRAGDLELLIEALAGNRKVRFNIAEQLDRHYRKGRDSQIEIMDVLQTWLSFLRDAMLLAMDSPVKPANTDHHVQLQQLVQRTNAESLEGALVATRKAISTLNNTNAQPRLALEVMLLDYPGLD